MADAAYLKGWERPTVVANIDSGYEVTRFVNWNCPECGDEVLDNHPTYCTGCGVKLELRDGRAEADVTDDSDWPDVRDCGDK